MGQTNDKPRPGRPAGSKQREKAARFDNSRFVNFELDKEQSATCKAWSFTSDDFCSEVQRFIDSGYGVSLKYDERNECYSCFIQNRGEAGPNRGLVLTGRGSTAVKAFKQCAFKDRLMDQDWEAYAERPTFNHLDD